MPLWIWDPLFLPVFRFPHSAANARELLTAWGVRVLLSC